MNVEHEASLRACPTCGLVQRVPSLGKRDRARCHRCSSVVLCGARLSRGNGLALVISLAALILYPLAVGLPIMRLERFGHSTEASVLSGSIGLLEEGEVFVGGLVFLCSVCLPLFKLLGLLMLCIFDSMAARHRSLSYHAIEFTGRWGMLDVLLVAIVVAWVKIGDLVQVTAGPGAVAFCVMVVLSLVASANFDPHSIWRDAPTPSPSTD